MVPLYAARISDHTAATLEWIQMPYSPLMSDEEFEKLIEEKPAAGTARELFYVRGEAEFVVKRTKKIEYGSNANEWFIWHQIKETDLADIFGACISTSPTRRFLMMEMLRDLSNEDREQIPPIPVWTQDVKGISVFGKNLSGQIKLRDYGLVNVSEELAGAKRAKKV